MDNSAEQIIPGNPKRKTALLAITGVISIAAALYGVYWFINNGKHETTDNAYVSGNVVQITSQIEGKVIEIDAQDTDFVRAGQVMVKLDDSVASIALQEARAELAQTVRETRKLYANNSTLMANITERQANVSRAKNELELAKEDLARRQTVSKIGAVSNEELTHIKTNVANAQSAYDAAIASVLAAKEQLASNEALTSGVSIDQNPNVLRAEAKLRDAYINLQRTQLVAPMSGYVAQRSAQIGQRIQAGAPLMAVIPLNQVWVDANFKEVQLRKIHVGQSVTLISDLYGKNVPFHGSIEGLSAGTGAAFALLPAQNATGNWIKVVQRVPVRINLDPKELAEHPLRIGLSMEVDADVSNLSGKALSDSSTGSDIDKSSVLSFDSSAADSDIKKIIAINLNEKGGQ